MGSTFYASGSADAFLADRGFDDKWVQKEERKKDVWEEVKTNRKKQLSGAEKRAKAAKISEHVLKNADAVRVDVDGQVLNRLLEKQARKEGMGEKGQEPKQPSSEKPKKKAPPTQAPAPKKEKEPQFVTRVPLTAPTVRAQLSAITIKHESIYAQMIALTDLVHEAFEAHRIDLTWETYVDVAASPKSWLSRPASLLAEDSIAALVEWLDGLAPAHLTELFEFLVENAMPGGGKLGRGGDKDYLGLKALLQIMLQRVKGQGAGSGNSGGSWHDSGGRLGSCVAFAEGRISAKAVSSVLWMAVQLAEEDAVAALRCYFLHLQPVLEQERGGGGKLALQCAAVLKHLLVKLHAGGRKLVGPDTPAPLSAHSLLRLLKLCFPQASQGISQADGPPSGEFVTSKNTEAVLALRQLADELVAATAVGLKKEQCAQSHLPVFLSVVGAEHEYSEGARTKATSICLRILASDPAAFKVLRNNCDANLAGTTSLLAALNTAVRRKGGTPDPVLLAGLRGMRIEVAESVGELEQQLSEGEGADKKHAGAAMALTNAKKQHRKLAKINEYKELLAQIDEVCDSRQSSGVAGVCWALFMLIFSALLLVFGTIALLTYVVVSDEECYKQVAPLAQDLLKRGSALDLNAVNGDLLIYAALGGACQSRLEAKGKAVVEVGQKVGKLALELAKREVASVSGVIERLGSGGWPAELIGSPAGDAQRKEEEGKTAEAKRKEEAEGRRKEEMDKAAAAKKEEEAKAADDRAAAAKKKAEEEAVRKRKDGEDAAAAAAKKEEAARKEEEDKSGGAEKQTDTGRPERKKKKKGKAGTSASAEAN